MGVSADRALKTVLGGEDQPAEEEMRNPDEMREWLLSAMTVDEFDAFIAAKTGEYTDEDYGECARTTARSILEAFLADPRLAAMPAETEYDWTGYNGEGQPKLLVAGVDQALRERGVRYPDGISGFQWGWALNAARYCVELPPVPNPAIMEL